MSDMDQFGGVTGDEAMRNAEANLSALRQALSASETVRVYVDTEVEAYPVLGIREVGEDAPGGYEVPATLLDALDAANDAVRAIEATIMERIAAENPDARNVAEWVFDRENDKKLEAARDAYEAAHPDGPSWSDISSDERFRLLGEAGWSNRHTS